MPLKKKTSMPKSFEKHSVPEGSVSEEGRNGQAVRRPSSGGDHGAGGSPPDPRARQMESFEEGMHLFHGRQFQRARELFLAAQPGPDRTVAHRAELHARMCERRLGAPAMVLNTAEEHYNYAVTLINSRDLAGAQKHLRAALEADPGADHVLYALAACQSLGGDLPGAYENLKRAIDLQPRNRLAARQDPDFAAMSDHQAFARLLYPDKKI
jgi:tetratricopeptide (TPR) repeat protein